SASHQGELSSSNPHQAAIIRSSDDLPAPLRPVTTRASPARRLKLTPLKTSRPPRLQASWSPLSSIRLTQSADRRRGDAQPGKPRFYEDFWRSSLVNIALGEKRPYKPELATLRNSNSDASLASKKNITLPIA